MRIKSIFATALAAAALSVISARADETSRSAYSRWVRENLPECPEFNAWQDSTGILAPDFSKMRSENLLPDPFTFYDGTKVGKSQLSWNRRAEEIRRLFQEYELGTFPPKPSIDKVEVLEESSTSEFTSKTVRLWFGPEGKGSVRVSITIPQNGKKGEKYPLLLFPSLAGPGNTALMRGYISAGFAGNDFMDDGAPLAALYPDYSFATLPRRAWLVSIVLDWFETIPEVDMDRIAVYGYSRDGKMAAIAAAYDERIDALVAGSTGVGGFVPWRLSGERGGGESIESTTRMFPTWFRPEFRYFSGKEDKLPVDANLLLSIIAPRAVLMEWGINDEVACGWGQEQVYASALPVYALYGAESRVSLLRVPGFHGSNDMQACMDFLDIQFGRSKAQWKYDRSFPWDFESWRKSSGENVRASAYGHKCTDAPLAKDRRAWEAGKSKLVKEVEYFLGEAPHSIESAQGSSRFTRRNSVGPAEMAEQPFNPGQLKPDVPAWVIAKKSYEFGWTEEDAAGVSSKRISFGPENVRGDLYYPKDTPEGKKLPVVIWLHGYHYPLGYMWVYRRDIHPVLALVKAGFAVLAFDQTGFGARYDETAPFYDRYPHWSRMGRMVMDVRDAVTALGNESMVDSGNISLFGFALGGTVGLYSAALDSRIRNVVSVCGFTPMRTDDGKDGMSGMTRYSHLRGLIPRLGFFKGEETRLPYDFDDLIALTAPRGVLVVQPSRDRDASASDVRKAFDRAAEVYSWYDASGSISIQEPDDYGRLTAKTQAAAIDWLLQHTR